MNAAERTRRLKMTKIRTKCATTACVMASNISVGGRDGGARSPIGRHGAASFADVRFVLGAEVLQGRQRRRRLGVAERAQRLAGDVVRDARQQIEIAQLPFAALDLREDLEQPVAAFAARRAL